MLQTCVSPMCMISCTLSCTRRHPRQQVMPLMQWYLWRSPLLDQPCGTHVEAHNGTHLRLPPLQVEQLQEQQEEAVARNAATAARIAEAMQELASSSGCSVAQVQAMLKSLKPSSKAGSPSSTSKAGSGSLKAGASGAVVSKGAVAGGSGPMLGSGGLPLGVRSLKR